MTKIVTALAVLGLVVSGRAFADGDTTSETTTTTQKTDGDGAKTTVESKRTTTTTKRKTDGGRATTTMETESKSDGAAGKTTRDETLTLEKQVEPGGNTEMKRDVKTSHKGRASQSTHRTHVEETTVRDAQGNVISKEKKEE